MESGTKWSLDLDHSSTATVTYLDEKIFTVSHLEGELSNLYQADKNFYRKSGKKTNHRYNYGNVVEVYL